MTERSASAARYPLKTVLELRSIARTRAQAELASAQRAHALASQAVDRARASLEEHDARVRSYEQSGADGAEPRSGLAVARDAAYARRLQNDRRALRSALSAAIAQRTGSEAALRTAQAALAQAHGAERVLELDQERFAHAGRARAARLEQEEHDDRAANLARRDRSP